MSGRGKAVSALFRASAIRPVAGTVCREVLLNAVGGSVGERVGLHPSQPLVAGRVRRCGLLRPGRTALRLLLIRRHRLSRASRLGRTRRATRVCFSRDTPWVKLRCWAINSGQLSKLVILCTIFGRNVGWVVNRCFFIVLHRAFPRWWLSSNYMIFCGKCLKLMTLNYGRARA